MSSSDREIAASNTAHKVSGLCRQLTQLAEARPGLLQRAEAAATANSLAQSAVAENQNTTARVLRQLSELCDLQPGGRVLTARDFVNPANPA